MDNRLFKTLAFVATMNLVVGCGDDGSTSAGSTTADTDVATTGSVTTSGPSTDATTDASTSTTTATTSVPTSDPSTSTGEPVTTTDTSSTGGAGVCGDGVVDASEDCDDGNQVETDACLATCLLASCGDGIIQEGVEACDDGNQVDDDVCLNTCALATCGDGFLGPGEACDDGNQVDDDECTNYSSSPATAPTRQLTSKLHGRNRWVFPRPATGPPTASPRPCPPGLEKSWRRSGLARPRRPS